MADSERMDRFGRLAVLLEDVLANPDPEAISTLQLNLERARPAFLALLDTPPKNQKERAQLEKSSRGTYTHPLTGHTKQIGPALAKEVLFLSDSINASEDLSAALVVYGIESLPRQGRGRAEAGLLVYLEERANLLRCLHAIWRGALSADDRLVTSRVQQVFHRETEELTAGKGREVVLDPVTKAKGTWIEKLLAALDKTRTLSDTLRAQLLQPLASSALVTATTHGASFSDETTERRIQAHDAERAAVAQLLFLVGAAGQLPAPAILSLTRELSRLPDADGALTYLLTALLAALDASDPSASQGLYPLFTNSQFVAGMSTALDAPWAVPPLRAAVQLQWSVFLEAAAEVVPNFETDRGELVESLTWSAIDNGVFAFLGRSVLAFKRDSEHREIWGGVGADAPELGGTVAPDFQDYVTDQVELLLVAVITSRISVLRKLRNRDEDTSATSHRGGGRRHSHTRPDLPKHDLEALFLLVATVYHGTPDAGLKFWEEAEPDTDAMNAGANITARLAAFLRWGSECRPPGMMRAYYEMVASLASGPRSATYAFEFLSAAGGSNGDVGASLNTAPPSPSLSWTALFGALEFYHQNLPDRPHDAGPNAEGVLGEMPPEEVPLLRSFVRLLRQVVTFSDVARATLYDNQRHRPIATLFALLGRPIPIELKASLLGAIAAFARPGGAFGVDVARRTWVALEQSQILPTLAIAEGRDARGGAGVSFTSGAPFRTVGPLTREGGIFTELEEVEAPNKVYPESTAFVELLNTLVHTPPSILMPLRRGVELDTQTIPDTLGAPHRAPGVDPYVCFVLDDILLKTGVREFADPRERWTVTETCLAFVEKCLASYDPGPFLAAATGQRSGGSTSPLAHLVVHPGFDILARILSGSELLETILTIVTAGYDAIAQNLAGTPVFAKCVLRCLRIILRTLELQAPFLEVVLPSLGTSSIHVPQEKLARLKSVAPIEQALLYNSDAVVQIALCVSCVEEDEAALLAVKILALIAQSPLFDVVQSFPEQARGTKLNRLVGLLDASPETLRILDGFVGRLDADVPESDLETGEWDGPDGANGGSLHQAIRSAILDLFLQGTQPGRAAPNIAHLLLGFDVRGRPADLQVDSPDGADSQRTSLHVILELLSESTAQTLDAPISLLARHPILAAKCYRLIRQLCLHPHTSAAVSRYLRTREQFFLRQSFALPFSIPSATAGALGNVRFSDGNQVVTSSEAVCAILQSEAWLLEATALELNVLAGSNDTQRELELVNALFGNQNPANSDDDADFFDQGILQQSLPRMLEIFHALDFAWHDSIVPSDHRLTLFAELRFDSCLRQDSTGCEVYDFSAALALLGAARRELQNRGGQGQQEEAKKETRVVVEWLVVENHRRQIQFARFHALRAWRSLLDITLAKAFHLLPVDSRHSLLLDFMSSILPPIAAGETDRAIGELLCGAAVFLMTKLRDEDVRNLFGEASEAVPSVSPERLHSVLRGIFYAILQPGVSAVMRGNLYAVLLNYLQYSSKMARASPALARPLVDESVASAYDDIMSLDGASTVGGSHSSGRRGVLEAGNLAIMQAALERLLPVVCRDAAVGHEVWRTVAFTALDALVTMAEEGRSTSKLLAILSKQGYLQNFVTALKDAEVDLLEALDPDPESLNALYIYEAQMSFLNRVASTREGAEKLLNADLFVKLAQCDYLGARPHSEVVSLELDGFLPPATERHHQLLLPALQLVVGTLVSYGADMPMATKQAVHFLSGQRENLAIALRNAATTQSIASLREAQLIVTLLGFILPSVSDEDLTTLSSYGGLHSALLALSAKVCGSQAWVSKVAPVSDTEREESITVVLALRNPGTLFSEKVQTLVESLEAALLTYHSVATRKRAGTNAFRPVWLPSLATENLSAPTLGSAGIFLHDTVSALAQRLVALRDVQQRLDEFESTAVDELEEALAMPEEDDLTPQDRRDRVLAELQSLQTTSYLRVASSLHLLEVALLLYWRHVSFFLDPERTDRDSALSRPDFGLGLAESLRSRSQHTVSALDLQGVAHGLSEAFTGIADRIGSLELTEKTVGPSFRAREAFIGTILRKLHEVLSLEE